MPETSIIIRTHNEEKHIGNLLRAIAKQDYQSYEVIVVDSGSTDATLKIAKEFKAKIISIESRDFTFGYSLNVGCENARGKFLVLVSAHVLPASEDWLSNIVAPFKDEKVAMVYGRQLEVEWSKFSEKMDFKRLFPNSPVNYSMPIEYSNNANSAVRRSLWQKWRFDEYLFGLEDIDWARKAVKNGYLIHYEPKAAAHHIHEEKWHQVFNRYRREAIAAVRIGLHKPPQSGLSYSWIILRLVDDVLASFPNWSPKRLEEILRFRYYQWKGSRTGWQQGKGLDFEKNKADLFFSIENKSVVITDKNKARMEDTMLPEMKPGDMLLAVDYVGVCRTDLEVLEGTLGYYRVGTASYPIVPGHEFSATVVRVGSNNKLQEWFKPGQKVVGECILSRDPKQRKEVGVINHNGAYAKFIMMPGDKVHHVPEGLSPEAAVMTEPLAVALRAIRRIKSRIDGKSSMAVIGAGPLGNLVAQTLSLDGYGVTVFDKNEKRLEILENKVKLTSAKIGGLEKFDVIVEVTGSKEVLEKVMRESREDSTILLLGFPYGNQNFNFEDLVGQEKVVVGSVGGDREDFLKALKLLPKLDMSPFSEIVLPLEDWKIAWKLHKSGKHLKILLKP